jgi:hypothetical protein
VCERLRPRDAASGTPYLTVLICARRWPYPGSNHDALAFRDTGIHGWKTILDFFDRTLHTCT